jgi:hypothetical protein
VDLIQLFLALESHSETCRGGGYRETGTVPMSDLGVHLGRGRIGKDQRADGVEEDGANAGRNHRRLMAGLTANPGWSMPFSYLG